MITQEEIQLSTTGRGTYDLTQEVQAAVARSGIRLGTCHVFVRHTVRR